MSYSNEKRGGLWKSRTDNPKAPFAKGEFTVNGETIRIVIWSNDKKGDNPKAPDFRIEEDKQLPQSNNNANKTPKPAGTSNDFNDDDIPF